MPTGAPDCSEVCISQVIMLQYRERGSGYGLSEYRRNGVASKTEMDPET